MAEFERCEDATTPQQALDDGRLLPRDYTAEEAETARWLNCHFDIAGEELPPLYAKTLLGDPRHAPARDDFEERTINAVFGRLHLERPVAPITPMVAAPSGPRQWGGRMTGLMRRVAQRGAVAVMAGLMLLSYNAIGTGVALASVLQLVVGRGGVQSVKYYPTMTVGTTRNAKYGDPTIRFTPQWVGNSLQGFTFVGMDAYEGHWWTDGALTALHYEQTTAKGTQTLSLLEFRPNVDVALQVVQDGSASSVQVGNTSGVYVSGRWVAQQQQEVWQSGTRAEIICHSPVDPNVVIWAALSGITPDDADNARALLISAVNSLQSVSVDSTFDAPQGFHYVQPPLSGQIESFNGDVLALEPASADQTGSTVFIRIDLTDPTHLSPIRDGAINRD